MMKPKKPFFSIIVPSCNRPEQLRECLESFCRLDYPRERFEVIVIDDGSRKPLNQVVKRFQNQLDTTLVRQENAGPAAARNTGASHARGEFLAFTDDDCTSASDWLRTLADRFDTPDHIVGGRTVNALHNNTYSATTLIIREAVYSYYNADNRQGPFVASNNMALSAGLFNMSGGFDTNFRTSEDREFCDRWLLHGYGIIYAPEAVVFHAHPLTFRSFCKLYFNYGRGAFRYHQIRARRKSGKKRSAVNFHLCLPWLLKRPMSLLPLGHIPIVIMLLMVWEVANTAGFFYEKHIASAKTHGDSND